ncbi:CBS domain-containing protein [Catellatospora sp. NPDC049111]|uniref:CBS domain-containing protein n=1 Tax=Catellatospora sp. NPDC049111 TaxID=3155271 RepID=UPI0033F134A8
MNTTSATRRDTRRAGLAGRAIRVVMTAAPLCVNSNTLLGDALAEMAAASLRHLVVVDCAGRCAGVLSDRCIVAAWAADPEALTCQRVSSLLESPAAVVDDATVADAAKLMRTAAVDAVAVVDSRCVPVGIVTGSDLVALLAR